MRYLISTVSITLIFILHSCGPTEKPKSKAQLMAEAKRAIEVEDSIIKSAKSDLDTSRSLKLIDMYITFVRNNPGDAEAGEYLFQAASLAMGIGDFDRSIDLFTQVTTNHHNAPRGVQSYFLIGFIYENYLDRKGIAETWYKKVIEYFPRHNLAIEARSAIDNLTLSDEELIRKFEKKNQVREIQ